MRKITILEGPDAAGKTTLAKTYFKDREYLHFGPPPTWKNGPWLQYMEVLKDLWDNPNGPDVVIDRFIYGELIYGPALRGKTDFTWPHAQMMERVLMGMGAELIICLPPVEAVVERWRANIDNELIKDEELIRAIWTFYYRMMRGTTSQLVPRLLYDYTDDDALHRLKDRHLFLGGHPLDLPNRGPGIGLFLPGTSYLLVGEIINTRTGQDGWPFVAADGCSLWLAQQLNDAQVEQRRLYWVNCMDKDHVKTSPEFVDKLNPRRIICMGNEAYDWARYNGLHEVYTVDKVMHPQAHKRFRHNSPYPLLELLHL